MAQYSFTRLDMLAPAGDAIPSAIDESPDVGIFSRAPFLISESKSASNATVLCLIPGISAKNIEVRIKLRLLKDGLDTFTNTGFGIVCRYAAANQYIHFTNRGPLTTSQVWGGLYKVAPTQTQILGTVTGPSIALYNTYWVKIRLIDNQFQWAAWRDGTSEPSLSSAVTVDDSGVTDPGAIGFRTRSFGRIEEIQELYVGTDGDSAPSAPITKTVSGVITDVNSDPASAIVRAYSRDYGILFGETVSDPITGEYTLTVPTTDEIQRVVLAPDGDDLLNDIIDRVIPG